MKKLIAALLAVSLMGSAFAQSAPEPTNQTPAPVDNTASLPGANGASNASLGELGPYAVVLTVVVVGGVVLATSSGGSKSNTTGTTK